MARFLKSLIFFLTLPLVLFPQSQDLIFDHLSVDDGLSNNIVCSILQDSRGFMWFGTEDGLNKYDGYNFTVYRHDPEDSLSISDNWVYTLHESHYGGKHVLWIGTKYGGLNRLDLETEQFRHFKNDPDDPQSLSNDGVVSICEDSFGDFWIGTNKGINKFNRETNKFIRYLHDPTNSNSLSTNQWCTIHESVTHTDTILWVGTWEGLNKFDRKTEKFIRYKHDRNNLNSLSNNNINYVFADTSGILWIATQNGGLNKFNIETEHFTRFEYDPNNSKSISSNMLGTILEDKFQGKKVLWIDSFNGLTKLDLETEQFTLYKHNPSNPTSLCDNRIWEMYKDNIGSIWIGTYGSGLSKFDPERQKFEHLRQEIGLLNSLSHNVIMSITESKYLGPNIFWIGTKDGGLNKYDRNTDSFTHYRHDPGNANSLSSDFVFIVLESQFQGRNELWIGTLGGLDKLDLKTKKFIRYQHNPEDPYSINNNIIRSIYEDKTGTLWIGTRNGGLNKFDRTSGKFNKHKYYIGEILAIFEDNTGTFWAGTSRGLARYNRDADDFTHYKHDPDDPNSLSHSYVVSMYEDKSSGLWIGTKDGLNLYDRETNRFIRYKVKDGLPDNVINGILEDNIGNLWLSTNHGLSKFNPVQKTFRNYDLLDGLQSNQFMIGASCLSKKGEMLFGGVNGINVFYPESIRDNPHIPDVYLTDFQIFNKTVNVKTGVPMDGDDNYYLPNHISNISEITLSYKENIFSFEFAALDYHSPQKNQYKYKMENVDPDWVLTDASRRTATYTNLDPGEYTFRVKGSNNDDIWNKKGTSIKIIITPPWWQTNIAYSFYILLIGSFILGIWRLQKNRLKNRYQMEKLEEMDRLKSRFFANISHEFRTPLTLIEGPVKQLLEGEFFGNVKEQYKMILRNSGRLLGLINQILDLSKLESGEIKLQVTETDVIKYLKGMVISFSSLAESNKVTLKFIPSENSIIGYVDRDKLQKIVTNLLSNAFKFTPENGIIEVTLKMFNAQAQMPNKIQNSPVGESASWRDPKSKIQNHDFGFCEINISNTGLTIPDDQLDKIFDRFYRVNEFGNHGQMGSGLGLALIKELVEVCRGEISVSSIPDKSTTFTVILPVSMEYFKEDEIAQKMETADRRPQTEKQHNIVNQTPVSGLPDKSESPLRSDRLPLVLIVEDNTDVTNYISSFMDNDYRIITAENGKVGLKITIDKYPDLIVSDVMMPEMDGFELCQKIKTDERISHIPVILLTAKADMDSKIEGLEFGADDYINKPFEADELRVRSKNLIDQRKKLREKFTNMIEINPGEITATSLDKQFLKRLMDVFENHVTDSNFSTEDFAREVGMSRSNLYLKVQALTNQSVNEFIRSLRLKRAAQLLRKNTGTVSEIAYEVGFNSVSHFTKVFRKQFGKSPGKFTTSDK